MLSQSNRFHGRASLGYVFKKGRTIKGNVMNLRVIRNDRQSECRVAIVVSKKVSKKAVVRNRIRRRTYEIIRPRIKDARSAHDLVFLITTAETAVCPHARLEQEVANLLSKAGKAG